MMFLMSLGECEYNILGLRSVLVSKELFSLCTVFRFNAKPDLSDFEEQEISIAVNCCSSSIDGLCWTYNYCYTKASRAVSQA